MADKVFVISLEKLEEQNIEIANLYHMPVGSLELMADFVFTPKEAVEQLNFPEQAKFNPEGYQCVYREIGDEEIHVKMGIDDWQEVIINKDLQVHIHTSDEGYTVDLYAYNEDTPDEERDYDNEFLGSVYTFYEEVEEARNPESED